MTLRNSWHDAPAGMARCAAIGHDNQPARRRVPPYEKQQEID
jgi:hypothetical protein